jgi:hypothetical protein
MAGVRSSRLTIVFALLLPMVLTGSLRSAHAQSVSPAVPVAGATSSVMMPLAGGDIPIQVLVQSPAETSTELQIICLFRSDQSNTLHGSLVELNDKLKGLLDQIWKPELFRGELGETLLLTPPAGALGAKRLLIVGLGDSASFTPERMEYVGAIVYREAVRLDVAQPYFAPTILDGGVTKFSTGEVADNFMSGFQRAARTQKILQDAGAGRQSVQSLIFLAGAAHVTDTLGGIKSAISSGAPPTSPTRN